jgi:hypothetical protein
LFFKLILKSWIFFIERARLIRTILLTLLINILHSKDLGANIGDVDLKKKHFLMFLLRLWHSKWEIVFLGMSWSLMFLYGLCFNKTSKICLINCFQILQHFLVEWLNIHGILSLYHISKYDLASGFRTHDIRQSCVFHGSCCGTPTMIIPIYLFLPLYKGDVRTYLQWVVEFGLWQDIYSKSSILVDYFLWGCLVQITVATSKCLNSSQMQSMDIKYNGHAWCKGVTTNIKNSFRLSFRKVQYLGHLCCM